MIIGLTAGSLVMAVGARLADLGRSGRNGDPKGVGRGAHIRDTTSKGTERFAMTTPVERTRALLRAWGFLIEIARDERLPLDVRQGAVAIARHFPTIEDVELMASLRGSSGLDFGLSSPQETPSWAADCPYGPLRYSTRVASAE
jgi:hypothetical protein